MTNKANNPLLTLWNALGTVGGIISLSSMAQHWMEDIVKWKGFILTVISSYQAIIRPFFIFIFQWLPFGVPYWIHDYLVFGFIVAASEYRASKKHRTEAHFDRFIKFFGTIVTWPFMLSGYPVTWPFMLSGYPKRIYFYYKRKKRPTFVRHNPQIEFTHRAMLWIGTIILGCLMLFSINTVL